MSLSQASFVKAAITATGLVLLVSSMASCGGSSSGGAQSWVGTFCGSGVSLRQVLGDSNDSLRAQLAIPELAPEDIKLIVVKNAASATAAAEKAAGRIKDQGAPSVKEGSRFSLRWRPNTPLYRKP